MKPIESNINNYSKETQMSKEKEANAKTKTIKIVSASWH